MSGYYWADRSDQAHPGFATFQAEWKGGEVGAKRAWAYYRRGWNAAERRAAHSYSDSLSSGGTEGGEAKEDSERG